MNNIANLLLVLLITKHHPVLQQQKLSDGGFFPALLAIRSIHLRSNETTNDFNWFQRFLLRTSRNLQMHHHHGSTKTHVVLMFVEWTIQCFCKAFLLINGMNLDSLLDAEWMMRNSVEVSGCGHIVSTKQELILYSKCWSNCMWVFPKIVVPQNGL